MSKYFRFIQGLRVGIIHIGAPAGGMNAATRIAARLCIARGHTPIAIRNGFSGLVKGEISPLDWAQLFGWQTLGGSQLGCNRDHPKAPLGSPIDMHKGIDKLIELGQIAFALQRYDINALLLIGGFEAYTSQLALTLSRDDYPAFCIPMAQIPATVSNNVPGTDYSLGSDTALNIIVQSCDVIKLSANASRKRVFVVEVQGGNCGYLATVGGLTVGASAIYIPEKGISLESLQNDVRHLKARYEYEMEVGIPHEGRLILRSENTRPEVYDTNTVSGILRAEGGGLFDSRTSVLGHLQQGGVPSPLDRIRATNLSYKCINWLLGVCDGLRSYNNGDNMGMSTFTKLSEHSCVVGIRGADMILTPVIQLQEETDLKTRRSKTQWWYGLGALNRTLAKRDIILEES